MELLFHFIHISNIGLKAVHNYFLGDVDSIVNLQKKLHMKKIALIAGDIVPVDGQLDDYFKKNKDQARSYWSGSSIYYITKIRGKGWKVHRNDARCT